MKKLFAIVLGLIIIFSTFSVRAEVSAQNTENISPETIVSSLQTENSVKTDGLVTLEFLRQISSWKELTDTVLPIGDEYQNIENKEDFYVVLMIDAISETNTIPIYHNEEYIKTGVGGIRLKEIDSNRLMLKYRAIIDIYNASNKLQLIFEPIMLDGECMQVDVNSTNVFYLEHLATKLGQHVTLKPNTKYWESAWNDGSGKFGVATDTNMYIPEDGVVTVNGVAYFDETRTNVLESYYVPYNELGGHEINIKYYECRMIHICTETTDLGWVYAEDLLTVENCK